jgi:Fic family protein
LSLHGLEAFCKFFLEACIDQVVFMEGLLKPAELLLRIQIFVEEEVRAKRLPPGSFELLREAVLAGSLERGRAGAITGYQERQARTILKSLLEKGMLVSKTPRGRQISPGFPQSVVGRFFPGLYPD